MAMMGWMRRTSRYFLVVVVLTFVASLAYFGATQDGGGEQWVVRVDGEEVTAGTYQRVYRATVEQLREALRDRFSEDLVRQLRIHDQVLEQLVTDRLIRHYARAEGIRVSDEELGVAITRMGVFREGGGFSRERYLRVLAGVGLTPSVFEEDLRSDLLQRKVQALIRDGVKVSEAEARHSWEARHARVRAASLLVPTERFLATVEVSDAEVEAYYSAHPAEFTRPERRRVLAAILPASSVPAPTVSDADVQAAYEARRSEFEQPERRRVAHVLIGVASVGGSGAEDAAKAKAEAALARVRAGADFAQVARELSEDRGTAQRDGEVGVIARDEVVAPFAEVAFSLKAGEVGGPVRTAFGYHVVKVLEVVPPAKKSLAEVAPMLRANLVGEAQLKALREKAEAAHQELLVAPDFAAAARQEGLSVRELGPFARTDPVEGIGRVRDATEAVFALPPSGVSGPVKIPEGYAIFRLLERQDPALEPLAAVKSEAARAVRGEKAEAAARAAAEKLATAWRGGADPRVLAKRDGATFAETEAFSRAQPLKDEGLSATVGGAALELPDGGVSEPVRTARGFYVVKTTARVRPEAAGFDTAREPLERELLQQKRAQVWQAWLTALRSRATIEVNQQIVPPS